MSGFSISSLIEQAFPLLLAFLCAHVALECRERAEETSSGDWQDQRMWVLAAGLALGTGVWSLHIDGVLRGDAGPNTTYDGLWLLAAWIAGTALGAGGVWATLARGPERLLLPAGAVLIALGAVLIHMLGLLAASVSVAPQWSLVGMGKALVLAAALVLVGLAIRVAQRRREGERPEWGGAAALALALGLLAVDPSSLMQGEGMGSPLLTDSGIPLASLSLLASLGSLALLVVTLITARREAHLRASLAQAKGTLARESLTDKLTRLPNREAFEQRMTDDLLNAEKEGRQVGLLFIDLDGFKPINESFGNYTGDLLLAQVAQRLMRVAVPGEMVARWGGDQFLIINGAVASREVMAERARAIMATVAMPADVNGKELPVQCSIGIAICPEDGAATQLVAYADAAAHAAKGSGGGTYCFFEPHMMHDSREQMDLLRDLRKAVAEKQLTLFYQPKIHAPSGKVTGAEALIRWNHPSKGLVSPGLFIPVAERFGLIGAIGNWVVDEACRQVRDWRDGNLRMRVGINLSPHQLRQDDLAERIGEALKRHSVNPDLITCEITESVAMEDSSASQAFFKKLEEIGVHISIDDFGTGYSSLARLRQLPAEELKIDASFVRDLAESTEARKVVEAVVNLGKALNLKVVAEGVETEAQRDILRDLGVNELQGFLFAKPMAANRLYLWAMSDSGPGDIGFRPSLFGDTQVPDVPDTQPSDKVHEPTVPHFDEIDLGLPENPPPDESRQPWQGAKPFKS